jgi:hypothetical protein
MILPMKNILFLLFIWSIFLLQARETQAQQWNWATMAGGGGNTDLCYHIDSDSQGNVYWVGTVSGNVNFSGQTFSTPAIWGVVAKYNQSGALQWVKTIESSLNGFDVYAYGISIDPNDNIYVCGGFEGSATFSPTISLSNGSNSSDIFLARFDTSGNVIWAVKQGNSLNAEIANDVFADEAGFIYMVGNNGFNLNWFKYDDQGNQLAVHAPSLAGNGNVKGEGIVVKQGKVFITGRTTFVFANFGNGVSVGSDTSPQLFTMCSDTSGLALWGRGFRTGDSQFFDISIDEHLNSLSVGLFDGIIVIDGDTLYTNGNNDDAILICLDSLGNTKFKRTFGDVNRDVVWSSAPGPNNTWYIGGQFFSPNFSTPIDVLGISIASFQSDGFLARINDNGDAEWVRRGEANATDYGISMHFDTVSNKLYLGGYAFGVSIWGNSNLDDVGNGDAYLAQLIDTTAFLAPPNLPQISVSTTDASCFESCNGEANISITGGYPPYWVVLDTVLISGNTIPNLCVGNYQLLVTDSAGQTANASFSIAQPDSLYLTWTIDLICNPVHYFIEAYAFGGVPPYQFLWPDGSQDYFYFPSAIDTDYVDLNVTDANGCGVMLSESLLPYVPLVVNLQQSFDTIYFHETVASFQWFFDGVAQASTDTFLVILSDGNYWLEFTDTYGCPGVSDTIFIDISTGVDEKVNDNFTMHPNPSQGLFQLIPDQKESPYSVQIFDSKGQLMMERACVNAVNFDLGAWPNGVYILRISNVNQAPRHLQFIKY